MVWNSTNNVETWAQANNLTLNLATSQEIVITDKRRRPRFRQPPPLDSISRVDVIKISGVTITNTLSVHEHVSNVISSCSQSVHALRILRTHGMTAASVHIFFKSVSSPSSCMPQAHGGLRDGRRSKTATSCHSPSHPFWTL